MKVYCSPINKILSIIFKKQLWRRGWKPESTHHSHILWSFLNFLTLSMWNECTQTERVFHLAGIIKLACTSIHIRIIFFKPVVHKAFLNFVQKFDYFLLHLIYFSNLKNCLFRDLVVENGCFESSWLKKFQGNQALEYFKLRTFNLTKKLNLITTGWIFSYCKMKCPYISQ